MRQRNGVAVFVAEDAARVADVGHRQLLVRQQGHQTRRTWGVSGRGGGGSRGAEGKERTQPGLKNEMSLNSQIGKKISTYISISLGTFGTNTFVSIWNCTLSNLS